MLIPAVQRSQVASASPTQINAYRAEPAPVFRITADKFATAKSAGKLPHVPPRFMSQMVVAPTPPAPAEAAHTAVGAVPACFKIGFQSLDIDAGDIRAILAAGRAFAPDVDAKLQAILGMPLRAGGLEALFTRLWPSAVWVASYEEVTEEFDMPRFTLSALDRTGKVIFDVNIGFLRNADGSIDMHASNAEVDRDHRGFGITAYAELMREKILQAYSTHPQTRLTLEASSAVSANTGAVQAASGYYVHALRGYMFSDSQNVPHLPYDHATPDGDEDNDLSQAALLAKYFQRWAQKQDPALSDFDCTALLSVCAQPFDYARITRANQPIGRAYLLSGEAPAWYGVHFVNPPAGITAADGADRERHRSKQVWDTQLALEIDHARARCHALKQTLWAQANAPDASARAQAYITIGMVARPTVLGFLEARLQQEKQPPVQKALQQAIALVRNERVNAGLEAAANDPQRPLVTREEMAERLHARQAATNAES